MELPVRQMIDGAIANHEKRLHKKPTVKGTKEYASEFEAFWKKFKGRYDSDNDRYIKVGKWSAFEEWNKLSPEQQEKAIAVADKVRGKFVPDANRWLKERRFDDFPDRKD